MPRCVGRTHLLQRFQFLRSESHIQGLRVHRLPSHELHLDMPACNMPANQSVVKKTQEPKKINVTYSSRHFLVHCSVSMTTLCESTSTLINFSGTRCKCARTTILLAFFDSFTEWGGSMDSRFRQSHNPTPVARLAFAPHVRLTR